MIPCPNDEILARYAADGLDSKEAAEIQRHLQQCLPCTDRFLALIRTIDPRSMDPTPMHGHAAAFVAPAIDGFVGLKEINRGGFGAIYEAFDLTRKSWVAIKIMLSGEREIEAEAIERFRGDFKTIAGLKHSHIVQVFGSGECGGIPYFSMELMRGGSLKQAVGAEPVESDLAARLVEQLAHAIHHAHVVGRIVHRDLKPANILLHPTDEEEGLLFPGGSGPPRRLLAKISDFGLVKSLERTGGPTLAREGIGTPAYMAPEQISGGHVEARTDVYALGAILYQLLAGRLPFVGADLDRLYNSILVDDPVPIRKIIASVPPELDLIAAKCLQKKPTDRFPTAQALAEELKRFRNSEPLTIRADSLGRRVRKWSRRHPVWASTAAASFVLLFLLVGFAFNVIQSSNRLQKEVDLKVAALDRSQKNEKATEAARREAIEKVIRMTVAAGQQLLENGDHAGAMLHFAEAARLEGPEGPAAHKHRVRLAATLRSVPRLLQTFQHAKAVRSIEFDPAGDWVLTASEDGTARLWNAATGIPRYSAWVHEGAVAHATFSPDGQRALTSSHDKTASLWNVATGERIGKPLVHGTPVVQSIFDPRGNGRFVTVASRRFQANRDNPSTKITIKPFGRIQVWDEEKLDQPIAKFAQAGWINCVEYRRDGLALVAGYGSFDSGNGVRIFFPDKENDRGSIRRQPFEVTHVAFSADGRSVLASSGRDREGEARLWDAESDVLMTEPLPHQGPVVLSQYSPDGRRVVTAGADGVASVWDARSGRLLCSLMGHRDRLTGAWFSPDGRSVLTASNDGSARLWDSATGQPTTPALKHSASIGCAAFDRDGRRIATAGQDGVVRVWEIASPHFDAPSLSLRGCIEPGDIVLSSSATRSLKSSPERIATEARFTSDGTSLRIGAGQKLIDMQSGSDRTVVGFHTSHICLWQATADRWIVPPRHHLARCTVPATPFFAIDVPQPPAVPTLQMFDSASGQILRSFDIPVDESLLIVGEGGDKGLPLVSLRKKSPAHLSIRTALEAAPVQIALEGVLEHAALSPKQDRLAALTSTVATKGGPKNVLLQVWEIAGLEVRRLAARRLTFPSNRIVWNPRGESVAAYLDGDAATIDEAAEGAVYLLSVAEESEPTVLKHKGTILHASFTPDGCKVLTASADRSARIWDAATGLSAAPPFEHRGSVYHVAYHPSGIVATASHDGAASLWDADTGERVGPALVHPDWSLHADFDPQGRKLATACCDGVVRVWDIAPETWTVDQWREIAEFLAAHRLDSTRGAIAVSPAEQARSFESVRRLAPKYFLPSAAAVRSLLEREWFLATEHLDWWGIFHLSERRLKTDPNSIALWSWRVQAAVQLGLWDEAAACFEKLSNLGELSRDTDYDALLVAIERGDKAEYRARAKRLIEGLGQKPPTGNAAESPRPPLPPGVLHVVHYVRTGRRVDDSSIVRGCLLVPDAIDCFDLPATVAKALPNSTLAALELRQNRLEGALQLLEGPLDKIPETERACVLFLRGLAESGLKRAEAEATLTQAKEAAAKAIHAPKGGRTLTWRQLLELRVLTREADSLAGRR